MSIRLCQTFAYFDLTGGVDLRASDLNMNASDTNTSWQDSMNTEFWGMGGFSRMKGNKAVISLPTGSVVLGLFEYLYGNTRILMFVYSDGIVSHICEGNVTTGTHTIIHSGFDKDAKCSFCNYLNGVVVSNGVDDPILYIKDNTSPVRNLNIKYQKGATPLTFCSYKGRLFAAEDSTLYYSGLGVPTDWVASNDAGSISNSHASSAPISVIRNYGNNIAIHRIGQVLLLSGSNPSEFTVSPFGDKGCLSPWGTVGFENRQLFYDQGIFALEYSSMKDNIQLSSEHSIKIHKAFETLNPNKINEMVSIHYPSKRQVWFYMATGTNVDLDTCWIMDVTDPKRPAWYRRVITPVTCGCNYNGKVYTGTRTGKILEEDTGNSADGTPYEAIWWSPWFTFGDIRIKSTESLYVALDGTRSNNCSVLLRYNTVKSKTKRKPIVSNSGSMGVFDSGHKFDSGYKFKDAHKIVKRVTIPKQFRCIQIGFSTFLDYAINGFEFYEVTVED